MSTILPVILSGGAGSRLWPASRSMMPKQHLQLTGTHTMLQETVSRLQAMEGLSPTPIVVCNESHRFLVAQQLDEIGSDADIIIEPEGRNTAPAIVLAALRIAEKHADSLDSVHMLILPADHVIQHVEQFHDAARSAVLASQKGALVTFGVVPTAPNTGYGYIAVDRAGGDAMLVNSFVEKPDLETAQEMVAGGMHFWNSGMFVFRPDTILQAIGAHAPDILAACKKAMAEAVEDADFLRPGREAFLGCPSDSIDYAVMEKADGVMMVPLDAGWNDVGSWSALHELSEKDAQGNVTIGDAWVHDCGNSYVRSESRLVTAVGVENLVIVETKDSVLVANASRSQDVKQLVDALDADNRDETSLHRQVYRPWGSYDSIDGDDGFQVKRLIVNPGAVLSLQMHHRRSEHWTVVRGTATITLNDDEFELNVDESTHIPIGARHRIANRGTEPVHIIEVQCGDYLGEDDIVRFEDNYGREGRTD